MAQIHPFRPLMYLQGRGDVSALVAPPYDVLDEGGKRRLLSKSGKNIVGVDLPHTPAKELGPASAYEGAAGVLRAMIAEGTLSRADRAGIWAYRQTFTGADGKTVVKRSGMSCCVDVVPFGARAGGGVLPHEETFSGPKEDRMALMRATRAQLSPIFGLHADEGGAATRLIARVCGSRAADMMAKTDDGVLHEVWAVQDEGTIREYQAALKGEDVFIADGHHRYTTQLNYVRALEEKGALAADHPAKRCMMVLVSMSDPGLVIWPTHRVLGGMSGYSIDAFLSAAGREIVTESIAPGKAGGLASLAAAVESLSGMGPMRFGLYDFKTGKAMVASPSTPDPLEERFAEKPRAWRELVVAYTQYVLVEKICQGKLNGGQAVKWAFPHTIPEVEEIGRGAETGAGGGKVFGAGGAQLAVIVRPTPLEAVRDVSRAGQLMPQKSTFFYPKLATGMWINVFE